MIEIVVGVGSAVIGSLVTFVYQNYSGRIQKMKCIYMEDDVLSKIPQKDADGDVTQNLHKKHFLLINTTNRDIEEFKVVFQFEETALIKEAYSRSKEGINHQIVVKNKRLTNQADATVKNFNRNDKIDFYITVANVNENNWYVSESDALGFKIVCEDKTEEAKRTKSKMSNTLLVNTQSQS